MAKTVLSSSHMLFNTHVSSMVYILLSQGCHEKLLKSWWLTTREVYFLTVSRGQKSEIRCCQVWFLLESLRKKSAPCLSPCFSWLPCNPWHSWACRYISPMSASILTFSSLYVLYLPTRRNSMDLGPTLIQYNFISILHLNPAKTIFK